jgi:hypothetical protein
MLFDQFLLTVWAKIGDQVRPPPHWQLKPRALREATCFPVKKFLFSYIQQNE